MAAFRKNLSKKYPVVEHRYRVCRNNLVRHLAARKDKSLSLENYADISYVKEVQDFLNERKGFLSNRLLLVTENENVAIKAALLLREYAQDFMEVESDEDLMYAVFGDWDEEEDDYEEGESGRDLLQIISLKNPISQERGGANGYTPYLTELSEKLTVLFTGMSGSTDIEEKLEVIGACPAGTQFIHVTKEQLKLPWVQELCVNYQCDQLEISELETGYYEGVLQNLLTSENYKLAKDLSAKTLLHKMQKKRGRNFREEDIAWYLDEAAAHARKNHPKKKLLEESDFPILFTKEENPMEQLEKLTGMQAVKEMAKEFAAIVQEEIHNESLGVLHKNMIFLGNPGTGKTTCARLMADIMAEEGNSNANFVVATRKDLIGEYVGQTAPKVAARFEEARGGILFVDEAGFFNNTDSGGFVQEAIKEFVRYMEVYPDVAVVFAMYGNEARAFMELDAGLSSRISRFVNFEDYTEDELCEILRGMLDKKGYTLDEKAEASVKAYMQQLRKEKKKQFGNAREARKLAESAIVASCVAKYQGKKTDNRITVEDIRNGCKRLQYEAVKKQEVFGFNQAATASRVQHFGA